MKRAAPRRCAECKKAMPATPATVLYVGWERRILTRRGPLCSIRCGAVAAVRLLERTTS